LAGTSVYPSVFIRQLNVLAAMQLLLDEPQLCSLVVTDKGTPGDGFFWVLNVDRDNSDSAKQAAHRAEVKRVHANFW
jgi:hypothetical protein